MTHKFYNRFIKPISADTDQAEREIVLNYLLVGIFALAVIALIDTLLAPIISGEPFYTDRTITNTATLLFIAGLYGLARYKGRHRPVAIILTLLIAFFACSMVYQWGLLIPGGILLCGLAIVMAGILISARSSLYVASAITVILAILQYAKAQGYIHPDLTWMRTTSTAGDVIGYAAMFFTIALVSWLFNRQMELSLQRAQRSERALQRQRDLLEIKVEKRARQLEEAQLEKMQQLYRFAELGQLSTALFHDLANHLSSVNLDIAGLPAGNDPAIMRRIQRDVGHINNIVKRVRRQIGGRRSNEVIDLVVEIKEVAKILAPTSEQANVIVNIIVDKSIKPYLLCKGDLTRFRQVILNLINNGIEAYPDTKQTSRDPARSVDVLLSRRNSEFIIEVKDHGLGVKSAIQAEIFKPFYTTKSKGIGIGLFIVKQIIENDFNGTVELSSDKQTGTVFRITLPKSYYARASVR